MTDFVDSLVVDYQERWGHEPPADTVERWRAKYAATSTTTSVPAARKATATPKPKVTYAEAVEAHHQAVARRLQKEKVVARGLGRNPSDIQLAPEPGELTQAELDQLYADEFVGPTQIETIEASTAKLQEQVDETTARIEADKRATADYERSLASRRAELASPESEAAQRARWIEQNTTPQQKREWAEGVKRNAALNAQVG